LVQAAWGSSISPKTGRALVYPIYKATHERQTELTSDFPATSTLFRDHVIMWSKDLQRTVDYLQTRPDIDANRIGYLGLSWGGAMGTIMVATEPRLKLAIFLVGGFYFQHARPEVEAINFAPRVRVLSLMLNGRYDFFFPVDASQSCMFGLIGVPEPTSDAVVTTRATVCRGRRWSTKRCAGWTSTLGAFPRVRSSLRSHWGGQWRGRGTFPW